MHMPRKFTGPRVLGPYLLPDGRWRVVLVETPGERTDSTHPTEAIAKKYKAILESELRQPVATLGEAIAEYRKHQTSKGNKPLSVNGTEWRLRRFFPDMELGLEMLTQKRCQEYYDALVAHYKSASSHRNILAEARSLLRFAVKNKWVRSNPLEDVHGVGRRNEGKPQLRHVEARSFYEHAIKHAAEADKTLTRLRAMAGMCALVLAMRATEIISRVGRDVDEEGRLLWIPDSKTKAGKRQIEVPPELAELLHDRAKSVGQTGRLFPFRREWVLKSVYRLCKETGVLRVSAHGLRGTHSTLAQQAGATSHLVAATLGHENPRITESAYTDRTEAAKVESRKSFAVLKGGLATEGNESKAKRAGKR